MRHALHLILLCAVLAAAGCTEKQADGSEAEMSEAVLTAHHQLEAGKQYDLLRNQMRIAELYYGKSYETLKDDPSQSWATFAEAGYRYACLLNQRGDMEGALAVAGDMLKKAEGHDDFPGTVKAFLLSLMAECQLHLSMPEAAKQNFEQAYEHQTGVLGGEDKGDFNLAILCSNIFLSFFEMGEYDEAFKWLSRYEDELRACERLGVGDSLLLAEHNGLLALFKARYLQATGRAGDAAAVYAAIPRSRISTAANIPDAIGYLMAAGRYDEAAYWYEQLDSICHAAEGTRMTFDNIVAHLIPRYLAFRKAGRNNESLVMADSISTAIDSALVWQKKSDAAELAVIYQTQEKELALEQSESRATIYRILAFLLLAITVFILFSLWRLSVAHHRVVLKNRELYDIIQLEQQREARDIQRIAHQPEEQRTQGERLFLRITELMKKEQPYTDAELNRDMLAQMLGTNHRYVDEAIRECSGSQSTNAFINSYRVDHAARMLANTDEPVALIAEMSGFTNRTTFNEQFRNLYKMTPSEYRRAAKA